MTYLSSGEVFPPSSPREPTITQGWTQVYTISTPKAMGRHPQTECIGSDEHSKRIPSTRDFALCDLFAIAITRKTAPKREDTRSSLRSNTSASERMKVHPEKTEVHAVASTRRTTESDKQTPDYHANQGNHPLYPTYRAALPHRPQPPTPNPDQRLQNTPSASAQSPGPNTECTPSPPPTTHPPTNPSNETPHLFATLTHQLQTIRSTLNIHKRNYSQLKTHHRKALLVFCTGRYSNWATADSKISHRLSAVSRALREERKWERQIVHQYVRYPPPKTVAMSTGADDDA